MIDNWDALKTFFKEEADLKTTKGSAYATSKVESVLTFVRSPTNLLFAHFLLYVHTEYLEKVLVQFQAEEPKIHLLRRSLMKLVKSLMEIFVKPSAFSGFQLHEVQYSLTYNQKSDADILIGDAAREFLKNKEVNKLREEKITVFYKQIKEYLQSLCKYLLEKLPLQNKMLKHVEVLDPDLRASSEAAGLVWMMETYPCLLPAGAKKVCVFCLIYFPNFLIICLIYCPFFVGGFL